MASRREPEVPDDEPERRVHRNYRRVAFPLADPLTSYEKREWEELCVLARMFRTTPEALREARERDDIPNWDEPVPLGEGQVPQPKERAMAEQQVQETVMAEGWDEVGKSVGSGGAWLKFKDGESHVLNFCGRPKHITKDFNDGKGAKRRVSIDVLVIVNGECSLKTWEMSEPTWIDLVEERRELGAKFSDAVFKVTRSGAGSDTRYKFRYGRQISPQEQAQRDGASAPPAVLAAGSGGPSPADDDIPF